MTRRRANLDNLTDALKWADSPIWRSDAFSAPKCGYYRNKIGGLPRVYLDSFCLVKSTPDESLKIKTKHKVNQPPSFEGVSGVNQIIERGIIMNIKCDKTKEEILAIILNHLEKNEELSKLAYNECYSAQYYSGKYDAIADLMDDLEIYV